MWEDMTGRSWMKLLHFCKAKYRMFFNNSWTLVITGHLCIDRTLHTLQITHCGHCAHSAHCDRSDLRVEGAEMSRTTSVIPEELEAIISSVNLHGVYTKQRRGMEWSFSGRTIAMEVVLHLMPTQVGDISVVNDAWRNSFRKSARKASIELIHTLKKQYKVQLNPGLILLHLQLRGVKLETAAGPNAVAITTAVCGSCGMERPLLCPTDDNLGNKGWCGK